MNTGVLRGLLLAVLTGVASTSMAQVWPAQRVTLVVPYPPGGPTDIVARTLGPALEQQWKQPFVIENRPGAGGVVGTDAVARSTPDGYTLLFNGNAVYTLVFFQKNLPWDPSQMRAVVQIAGAPYIVVTNPQTGIKSMPEFLSYVKARPPKSVNYGTIPLTTFDLDYLILQQKTGIQLTVVPYNGAAPAGEALMRNDTQMYFGVQAVVAPMIEAGRLVAIGNTGTRRSEQFPDVPTVREQGTDFTAGFGFGIWVPAKTPEYAVTRIGNDIAAAIQTPAVAGRLKDFGYEVPAAPLRWNEQLQAEFKAYSEVVQRQNIQPQ